MKTASGTVKFGLLAIVAGGFLLRLWGIGFGLPYLYHPDEPNKIQMAQRIVKTGDLNPHYFKKPSFFIYLNTLAYVPYYVLGKAAGRFTAVADVPEPVLVGMGIGWAPDPMTVLIDRYLTLLFGAGAILMTFLLALRLSKTPLAALLAAFMMAISPTGVAQSRYITPDAWVTFFILLAAWASLNIYERGRRRDYLLAGAAVALAIGCKYPGGVALVPVVAAHFLAKGRTGFRNAGLYGALLACAAVFLITNPYAVLDYPGFLRDTLYETEHYATAGHSGMEGSSLAWYLSYLWSVEGLASLLAVFGVLWSIHGRSARALILVAFPAVYFVFISLMAVRNDRTLLPVMPFVFVFAADLVTRAGRRLSDRAPTPARRAWGLGLAAMVALALVFPVLGTVRTTQQLTNIDSRETARRWIVENIPAGAKVAVESYSPFVDPRIYQVQSFLHIIDHDAAWYAGEGFSYLIGSQGMYGRYFETPALYSGEIAQYNAIFDTFPLMKRFDDGQYEIRIHTVSQTATIAGQ